MGISPFKVSSDSYNKKTVVYVEVRPTSTKNSELYSSTDINPKPNNYKIQKFNQIGNYLIIKINYPNCTNFEGNKILVYENTNLLELMSQKLIDPHFSENQKYKSPIARFVPTEKGWSMATSLCNSLLKDKK